MNPFFAAELPRLSELLGGELPSLDTPRVEGPFATAFPFDASLDTEGVGQSGTGQAALLTGVDAARLFGRHFGPWIPVALRPIVEEQSFLRRAVHSGLDVAFANALPRDWPGPRGSRGIAGPPLAARGAGLLDRHEEALTRGDAVSGEFTNRGWVRYLGHTDVPIISAEEAGANLARIAGAHDLTLFAHYATDTAGHEQALVPATHALQRVDRFLGGLLDARTEDLEVLIVSDHGNIEDVRVGHTQNPALGLLLGDTEGLPIDGADLRGVPDLVERLLARR